MDHDQTNLSTIIIPVGGYGTRMLPTTQSVPKTLLPAGEKPLLVHAVDEALASGATNIIIACRPDEIDAFKNQFTVRPIVEQKIKKTGREYLLDILKKCDKLYGANVKVVPIFDPDGPAATIGRVINDLEITDEAFGAILPDDLFIQESGALPVMEQLAQTYNKNPTTTLGVRTIDANTEKSVNGTFVNINPETNTITDIQIKPKIKPDYEQVSCGRYIFNTVEFLKHVSQSYDENIKEASMSAVLRQIHETGGTLNATICQGEFFDCGDRLKYMTAQHTLLGRILNKELPPKAAFNVQSTLKAPEVYNAKSNGAYKNTTDLNQHLEL